MRAISLHRDVIVVTSALLHVNCVVVRGQSGHEDEEAVRAVGADVPAHVLYSYGDTAGRVGETFVIDSPVLPEELDALPALLEQAGFPPPSGLLATHGDWDHLLGRLAFPGVALGCAESTVERLAGEPGAAQRALRSFDEELYIERPRPLALGSIQALPVPGRCEIAAHQLELHPAEGHTVDGMAIWIPWARVLVVGDYVSTVEVPTLNEGDRIEAYLATLERLRPLLEESEHVVPGHGPVTDRTRALAVLEEDVHYLNELRSHGAEAELPAGRHSREQRRLHVENVAALLGDSQ